jgi:hypothetical protein
MKNKVKRGIFIIVLTCVSILNNGCSNKTEFNSANITKIYIQNGAIHRYGGIEQAIITDKAQITDFCNKISQFKNENNKMTKPFNGSVEIEFVYLDRNGIEHIMSKYSTSIVFKENNNYFITNANGQFTNYVFLKKVKLLLKMR